MLAWASASAMAVVNSLRAALSVSMVAASVQRRPSLLLSPVVVSEDEVHALAVPTDWSATLASNVAGDAFLPFMRDVIAYAEEDLGLTNYHLRFCVHPPLDKDRGRKVDLSMLTGPTLEAAERAGCFVYRRRASNPGVLMRAVERLRSLWSQGACGRSAARGRGATGACAGGARPSHRVH
jgi:hypothetical protein